MQSDSTTNHEAIRQLVQDYGRYAKDTSPFEPGITPIPPSGKVLASEDLELMIEAVLDGWLTTGRFNDAFEKALSDYLGVGKALTTNSGSSANLLALSALTSPKLGERRLKPGDEVITVAAGFPTTVNPIIVNGLIPVFVDVEIPTYNIDVGEIEDALSSQTRAIMIAHTLGNPFQIDQVAALAEKHNLWLIEDCCDALGSEFDGRRVGTFGHIGTLSFYPAHHITMGEGGAVFTSSAELAALLESFRDWGRDCYCVGSANLLPNGTCGNRFDRHLVGYDEIVDHKFIFGNVGYNLKPLDLQGAIGLVQLEKSKMIHTKRRHHKNMLEKIFLNNIPDLRIPGELDKAKTSWFGLPIICKNISQKRELVAHLESNKIQTECTLCVCFSIWRDS